MPTSSRVMKAVRNVVLMVAMLVAVFIFGFVPWFFAKRIAFGQYHYPDPNDGKPQVL